MDAIARAWLEFAKDKTRAVNDSARFMAFYASDEVQPRMLARIDPDAENDGKVRPVTEDAFHEPWLGIVAFVYEGVAIVKTNGVVTRREVKFP